MKSHLETGWRLTFTVLVWQLSLTVFGTKLGLDQMPYSISFTLKVPVITIRLHPDRALERRNLVSCKLCAMKMLSAADYEQAIQQPLGVSETIAGAGRFPAYLDLVRQQLQRDYKEGNLRSQGPDDLHSNGSDCTANH